MPRGGYRQPRNPAPVSGPGSLSKRTDGGAIDGMQPPATQAPKYMAGLGYGKGGNMEQQSGAPMAGNDIPATPAPIVPLMAPTQRPNEPVTAGIDMGAGPGSEAIIAPSLPQASLKNTILRAMQFGPSDDLELIYRQISDSGY